MCLCFVKFVLRNKNNAMELKKFVFISNKKAKKKMSAAEERKKLNIQGRPFISEPVRAQTCVNGNSTRRRYTRHL